MSKAYHFCNTCGEKMTILWARYGVNPRRTVRCWCGRVEQPSVLAAVKYIQEHSRALEYVDDEVSDPTETLLIAAHNSARDAQGETT